MTPQTKDPFPCIKEKQKTAEDTFVKALIDLGAEPLFAQLPGEPPYSLLSFQSPSPPAHGHSSSNSFPLPFDITTSLTRNPLSILYERARVRPNFEFTEVQNRMLKRKLYGCIALVEGVEVVVPDEYWTKTDAKQAAAMQALKLLARQGKRT